MNPAPDAPPPPITPDEKDWTWVLDTACPECGFEAATFDRHRVGAMLRANADEWIARLAGDPDEIRRRPAPDTWSTLEYAAHVRDVFRIYDERLVLMLDQDGPSYPNWDQDATAIEDRYDQSDPPTVAAEIGDAATCLADRFDTVTGDQWDRTGFRSDGAAFTVETFARYFIHDPIHHLHDVDRGAR